MEIFNPYCHLGHVINTRLGDDDVADTIQRKTEFVGQVKNLIRSSHISYSLCGLRITCSTVVVALLYVPCMLSYGSHQTLTAAKISSEPFFGTVNTKPILVKVGPYGDFGLFYDFKELSVIFK